ncbi:glycogen debranching N-terminal domain-containing protein [Streptomyces sp. SP18CS02]|uniref:glycogen debranching N-terminal domain-containing protein n=1 Tax=Streptomyces sp. SP18CS02 TaxID=3002531 RepID=UPI002E77B479|nr:glycogen debranching N-terminal domain-containing protein [Streptomyces sp. SP18CS02]MEE1751650.1 glycogen debranching N-terminal domain-containing protein [Streptomyces sp. SP18CS02]
MDLTVVSQAPQQPFRQPSGAGLAPPNRGRPGQLPPVHHALLCVALPCLAVSAEHGQLTGQGLEGVYQAGRRLLSRSRLRVFGREPVTVQARLVSADTARFIAVVHTPADPGPDPGVTIERTRDAEGTERITFRSSAGRTVRLPVEMALGTDLADLAAVAAGRPGPELRASVHTSGMRWSASDGRLSVITAEPAPKDALASAGLLRWELALEPGAARTIELRVRSARPVRPAGRTGAPGGAGGQSLSDARAEGDDPRVERFLRSGIEDLRALLLRDPARPADLYPAAGVPWRSGPAPAESLWAARMALPLGTRLATATLRVLARTQLTRRGPGSGRIPGPLRDSGPHLPPGCTGVEATLAFPAVLAEAWRWGMPDQELAELLPAAERCLEWLRSATGADGLVREPGPPGLRRADSQAHAHRAALLGADLLEACGRPGAEEWRDRARALRHRFREDFWLDDRAGGRPAAARTADGRLLPHLGASAAHLLDTGLLGRGRYADGLLDKVQTEQVARLLGSPAMDSGWGLRSLGSKEPGHNPFGHRAGAVRVHETAVAVAGLAAAGYEKEAGSLLRGLLDAAEAFAYRLPEMYAGEQRVTGGVPAPHPAACRPAAVASAAAVRTLTALCGIRPDVPARTVALHPVRSAPLGAIGLSGLRVAGEPFAVRVSRMGLGMVEEAAGGLQLGV